MRMIPNSIVTPLTNFFYPPKPAQIDVATQTDTFDRVASVRPKSLAVARLEIGAIPAGHSYFRAEARAVPSALFSEATTATEARQTPAPQLAWAAPCSALLHIEIADAPSVAIRGFSAATLTRIDPTDFAPLFRILAASDETCLLYDQVLEKQMQVLAPLRVAMSLCDEAPSSCYGLNRVALHHAQRTVTRLETDFVLAVGSQQSPRTQAVQQHFVDIEKAFAFFATYDSVKSGDDAAMWGSMTQWQFEHRRLQTAARELKQTIFMMTP